MQILCKAITQMCKRLTNFPKKEVPDSNGARAGYFLLVRKPNHYQGRQERTLMVEGNCHIKLILLLSIYT